MEVKVARFNKVEQYFNIYNITINEENVKYASMHLKGNKYNYYLWWKGENYSYNEHLFKNNYPKRLQGITENKLFSEVIRLQQKGSVKESTHQWKALVTWVFGLSSKKLLET